MNNKINDTHALFINWITPFIEVLKEKGGSATTKEIREGVAEKMELAEEFLEQRYEKSKLLKFDNQIYWAKQYLAWEKLVETSKRGIWTLTDEGWKTSMSYTQALALHRKWVKIHSDARKRKENPDEGNIIIDDFLEDNSLDTDVELNEELTLLEILKRTTATGFEHLCRRLLLEYDFEDVVTTPRSHDGGIDGTAIMKLNSFVHMSVYFQCKKYDGTVPIGHVREFLGVLATDQIGVDRGLFITTGTLPKAAYELERRNSKLELIDGDKLVEMFEKSELGVNPRVVYDPNIAFFAQYITQT
jgi:restriction system protein